MSSQTVYLTAILEALTCGECAAPFAILASRLKTYRENGEKFYCPNGHYISFSENENAKLRKRVEWAERDAMAARERANQEAKAHAATKGQLTKIKTRVAAGVCPSCKRCFTNVARHMATKHPQL